MVSDRLKTAIRNAVGWLRANPEKHIIGDLAVDANGRHCFPNSPSAECFCALGRVSKELDAPGMPAGTDSEFRNLLLAHDVGQSTIYTQNDTPRYDDNRRTLKACNDKYDRGNPAALDILEELIK